MKKYLSLLLIPFFLMSCDPKDWQRAIDSVGQVTNAEAAEGLKQALSFGVKESVGTLSARNGYYDSAYKILLPQEAYTVINKLKIIPGFDKLEETLIKKINQGAEDAATKAGPIFLNAIKKLSFSDVMNILMGDKNAATQYLHNTTYNPLYGEFKPVLITSLNKFGALDYWADAVNKYNKIPLLDDVNPDLADHITGKALFGLFDLVEAKELGIRTDVSQRTTDLLKKVFKKQDKS